MASHEISCTSSGRGPPFRALPLRKERLCLGAGPVHLQCITATPSSSQSGSVCVWDVVVRVWEVVVRIWDVVVVVRLWEVTVSVWAVVVCVWDVVDHVWEVVVWVWELVVRFTLWLSWS